MSVLDHDVDHLEYEGRNYSGMEAGLLVDRLNDEQQMGVFVVLKSGFRTSLSKFLEASGSNAGRAAGGKVLF